MYGGCPTDLDLPEDPDTRLEPFFSNNDNEEHFMMRLDKDTHQWKSVTYTGAPADIWDNRHYRSAGVQNTFEQIRYSVLVFVHCTGHLLTPAVQIQAVKQQL